MSCMIMINLSKKFVKTFVEKFVKTSSKIFVKKFVKNFTIGIHTSRKLKKHQKNNLDLYDREKKPLQSLFLEALLVHKRTTSLKIVSTLKNCIEYG